MLQPFHRSDLEESPWHGVAALITGCLEPRQLAVGADHDQFLAAAVAETRDGSGQGNFRRGQSSETIRCAPQPEDGRACHCRDQTETKDRGCQERWGAYLDLRGDAGQLTRVETGLGGTEMTFSTDAHQFQD